MNYPAYCCNYEEVKDCLNLIDSFEWSKSPFAVEIIIEHFPAYINWAGLCQNTNPVVIPFLENNKSKIVWALLSANPNAMRLIKENLDKISWSGLSLNNCAYKLLKNNQDKIDWINICLNDNPKIIKEIVACNLDKPLAWNALSENNCIEAVELLKANPDKINWEYLSLNSNDEAIKLLLANPEKIVWENLITNENEKIIEIFRNNQDKIIWGSLAINGNDKIREVIATTMSNESKNKITRNGLTIFEYIDFIKSTDNSYYEDDENLYNMWRNCYSNYLYKVDYEKMRKNFEPMAEEIIKEAMHPKRVCKLILSGYDLEELFE